MTDETEEKICLEVSQGYFTIAELADYVIKTVGEHPDSNDLDRHAAAVMAQKILAVEQVFSEAETFINDVIGTVLPSVAVHLGQIVIPSTMTNVGMKGGQYDE